MPGFESRRLHSFSISIPKESDAMDRKTASSFAEWKRDPEHGILLVRGGRRVGKTYSIMRFVKKSYRSYAYFDLETDVRARDVITDPDLRGGVLDRLLYGTPRMAAGSAVVIEGIHLIGSPRASLQSIALDGRFDVILSGSIIEDDPGIPGCQVSVIEMRGLDFEEFLWATGFRRRHTEYLRECVNDLKPIDRDVLEDVSNRYREYVAVGGLPEAVRAYSRTCDYSKASSVLKGLVKILEEDAADRCRKAESLKAMMVFRSAPLRLGLESSEPSDEKGRRIIDVLLQVGAVEVCRGLDGLSPMSETGSCKVYMGDTGIACAMLGGNVKGEVIGRDPSADNGALIENAVACELRRRGYPLRFYRSPDGSAEVDFVAAINGKVAAIEVKSGGNRRSRSLNRVFLDEGLAESAMKLSESNVMKGGEGIVRLPLFAVCFLPDARNRSPSIQAADISDEEVCAGMRVGDDEQVRDVAAELHRLVDGRGATAQYGHLCDRGRLGAVLVHLHHGLVLPASERQRESAEHAREPCRARG